MKYARLDPMTGLIASYVDITLAQYQALDGNPKQAFLRQFTVDTQPVPSATQIVREGLITIGPVFATQTWVLENKSAQQLAAEAAVTADSNELDQLRLIYAALKAGTGTATERLVRVEKAVAWLLKKYGAHQDGGP